MLTERRPMERLSSLFEESVDKSNDSSADSNSNGDSDSEEEDIIPIQLQEKNNLRSFYKLASFLVAVDLKNCSISDADLLYACRNLRWAYLSENFIEKLPNCLPDMTCLEYLDLSNNQISTATDLLILGRAPSTLLYLNLDGNFVTRLPRYRNFVISSVKSLLGLDSFVVADEERIPGALHKSPYCSGHPNMYIPPPFVKYTFMRSSTMVHKKLNMMCKRLRALKSSNSPVIRIQRACKDWFARRKYAPLIWAVVQLQAYFRGRRFRRILRQELEEIIADAWVLAPQIQQQTEDERNRLAVIIQQQWKNYYNRKRYFICMSRIKLWLQRAVWRRRIFLKQFEQLGVTGVYVPEGFLYEIDNSEIVAAVLAQIGIYPATSFSLTDKLVYYHVTDCFLKERSIRAGQESKKAYRKKMAKWVNSPVTVWKRHAKPKEAAALDKLRLRGMCFGPDDSAYLKTRSSSNIISGSTDRVYHCFCPDPLVLRQLSAIFRSLNPPIAVHWDVLVLRGAAAAEIQRVWRGARRRSVMANMLISILLKRRAAVAVQRWWRYRSTLYRRFQLLSQLSEASAAVTTPFLFLDPWTYYLLIRCRRRCEVPYSMTHFPEFEYDVVFDGHTDDFLFGRRIYRKSCATDALPDDQSNCFLTSEPNYQEYGHSSASNNATSQAEALLRQNHVRHVGSLASDLWVSDLDRVSGRQLERFGLSLWLGRRIRVLDIDDRRYQHSEEDDKIFDELLTRRLQVTLQSILYKPSATSNKQNNNSDGRTGSLVVGQGAKLSTSTSTVTAIETGYRVVEMKFASLEEARTRCALIMLLTYDASSWSSIRPMSLKEMETRFKIKLPEIFKAKVVDPDQSDNGFAASKPSIGDVSPIEMRVQLSDVSGWQESQSCDVRDVLRFRYFCETLAREMRHIPSTAGIACDRRPRSAGGFGAPSFVSEEPEWEVVAAEHTYSGAMAVSSELYLGNSHTKAAADLFEASADTYGHARGSLEHRRDALFSSTNYQSQKTLRGSVRPATAGQKTSAGSFNNNKTNANLDASEMAMSTRLVNLQYRMYQTQLDQNRAANLREKGEQKALHSQAWKRSAMKLAAVLDDSTTKFIDFEQDARTLREKLAQQKSLEVHVQRQLHKQDIAQMQQYEQQEDSMHRERVLAETEREDKRRDGREQWLQSRATRAASAGASRRLAAKEAMEEDARREKQRLDETRLRLSEFKIEKSTKLAVRNQAKGASLIFSALGKQGEQEALHAIKAKQAHRIQDTVSQFRAQTPAFDYSSYLIESQKQLTELTDNFESSYLQDDLQLMSTAREDKVRPVKLVSVSRNSRKAVISALLNTSSSASLRSNEATAAGVRGDGVIRIPVQLPVMDDETTTPVSPSSRTTSAMASPMSKSPRSILLSGTVQHNRSGVLSRNSSYRTSSSSSKDNNESRHSSKVS